MRHALQEYPKNQPSTTSLNERRTLVMNSNIKPFGSLKRIAVADVEKRMAIL
jgi:hypothetical protein